MLQPLSYRMVHTTTRKHPRFPLRLPVLCVSPAVRGYRTVGLTQNVSLGGLLLEIPQPLSRGTPMSLVLPTGDQNARAEAVVVWATEDTRGRMGLQFTRWAGVGHLAWERLLAFQAGPTRRASVRIPIALEVTCRIPSGISLSGRAKNLNDGGLMVTLPRLLPPQTRLTVVIPPWVILSPVEAEMEVVWARAAPEGHSVLYGLRFCADDIGKELFLVGALLRQLIEQEEGGRGRDCAG